MKVSIIAALADNGVIGRGGALPWHLPDDLRRFKSLTMGHPLLMGRRTFESIGRALPGRRNLVLTRGARTFPDGIEPVASLEMAMMRCADAAELCVIGGAEVYAQAFPLATRLELTRVHVDARGDVRFPEFDAAQWRELERIEHRADARHEWPMTFLTLERV
ncbi:MAG TPA: dihydrofolate reductase [Steroidobacteraceae bacterium]|nr:dihydrofolate reductase [Steroidobacteraceae bacterium]